MLMRCRLTVWNTWAGIERFDGVQGDAIENAIFGVVGKVIHIAGDNQKRAFGQIAQDAGHLQCKSL